MNLQKYGNQGAGKAGLARELPRLAMFFLFCLFVGSPLTAGDSTSPTPHQKLDQMDTRTPVPMFPGMALHFKQNMQDHLRVMQEITMALARDDYQAIEASAARLGPESAASMCDGMGQGVSGFRELADAFHQSSLEIVKAAQKKKKDRVLQAMGNTMQFCISCHNTYRQQVVEGGPGTGRGGGH